MDEPLSNLDAKLRVQMRSEIARIQHELATTTLYVTHDQVEAMTMGDRVAVIRKGVLQQVDSPQYLYDHPNNLFVAGFIGSPAMNMVEATIERSNGSSTIEFGGYGLGVPEDVLGSRPGLKAYEGKQVIVGIRPEDMEDASLVPDAPRDRRIMSGVILREALGAVHGPREPDRMACVANAAVTADRARRNPLGASPAPCMEEVLRDEGSARHLRAHGLA